MFEVMPVALAASALVIEAVFGYPEWLLGTIGHPVTWIGALIGTLDRIMNRGAMSEASRGAAGAVALAIVIGAAGTIAYGLEAFLGALPGGLPIVAVLASTLVAQRSLHAHVAAVATALERGLAAGREAVAHIVGRDVDALDEAGVARAAIESLAENFSDGVVAPAFWLTGAGLAGGAAYKAINTADSIIGHRTQRHRAFGFAAARMDDFVNLPASRLAALLIVAAAALPSSFALAGEVAATEWRPEGPAGRSGCLSADPKSRSAGWRGAWRAVLRDAHRHRSPNAGYPEAAMAGALGLALGGPRVYGGVEVKDALMGNERREATAADIRSALALYRRADALLIALVAVLAAGLAALVR